MSVPDSAPAQTRLPWWAMPAVFLDRLRPGLAARAAEDAAWLGRLPRFLGSSLPVIVILIPIAFAVPHALAPSYRPVTQITFQILDLYTESIPFLILAAIVGLAAPTLGVLFLASHVVADLVAAFIQPLELTPLPTALAGRFVSFWVLYLLVAELPMAAHDLRGGAGWRRFGPVRGLVAAAAGAASAGFFAWTWGIGAPLLLRQVWTWSDLNAQTANAGTPLLDNSSLFGWIVGGAAFVLLALRGLRPSAEVALPAVEDGGRGRLGGLAGLAFGVAVPLLMFASVITKPIDAVVLIAAVLLARPISVLILRRTGLVRPLAAIPRPVRLVAGLAISIGVSYAIILVLGVSTLSSFFAMVVAMAVSYILIRTLLDADDLAPSADEAHPSLAAGIAAFVAIGALTWIFAAGPVFADNGGGQTDGWGVPLAAGAAAAGAGGLAAASARQNKKKPNPPPWYVPDSTAEFFGYDKPKPPPEDKKKQPDWTKKKPPPPGTPEY